MGKTPAARDEGQPAPVKGGRVVRADAKRNLLVLLEAAKDVFATSGVDAPVRDIADRA